MRKTDLAVFALLHRSTYLKSTSGT